MKRWPGLAAGLFLSTCVAAQAPLPDDFAFGYRIEVGQGGALQELELPEEVYRRVTRRDLGDIRVFNGAGEPVPFTLRRPESVEAEPPPPVSLPFFPLRGADGKGSGRSVHVVTDEGGAVVDVTTAPDEAGGQRWVTAWLIDATTLEQAPSGLALSWEGGSDDGFTANVGLERSDDLSHWSRLVAAAGIADLRSGDARLTHREIDLPRTSARYLRLSWPKALRGVRLTSVRAMFPAAEDPPPRHWLRLSGTPFVEQGRSGYRYDSGGHWPVDRARLDFPTRNGVLRGTLLSRAGEKARWIVRSRGLFYRLEQGDTRLESEPVRLATTPDPQWRLETGAGEAPAQRGPVLELGWVAHRLVFVAQGGPPFTLVFGNNGGGPADRPVTTLLEAIDEEQERTLVRHARAGQLVTLGGEARLQPPSQISWRQLLLWTVLLLGVALLGWMVRRLFRQMGESE